jgi:hypothetical protein
MKRRFMRRLELSGKVKSAVTSTSRSLPVFTDKQTISEPRRTSCWANNRRQPAWHPIKTRLAPPPDPSYNMLFVGFAAHGARATIFRMLKDLD